MMHTRRTLVVLILAGGCLAHGLSKAQMSMPGMQSSAPVGAPSTGVSPSGVSATQQEQEHPQRQTGTPGFTVPDLLADVRARAPQDLAFFESGALASNPALRIAAAQVTRQQGEARQQALWSDPEVGYEADHIRGGSYAGGEQGGYIQQVVPIAGQRSSAAAAARQQAQVAEASLHAQQERMRSAVEQAFYAALTVQEELAVRKQLLQISIDAAETAHQLANVGQADAPDLLQSEVEREQTVLEYAAAQGSYRKAFAALAAIAGDARLPVSPLKGELDALPSMPGDAAKEAMEGSPTLTVAEQQSVAAEAAVRAARRQGLPQLTLHAGLQQSNEPLGNSGGRVGVVGVAQAGLTLPLWNRNRGAVEAAKAAASSSKAEVALTALRLDMQAQQAAQDYAMARLTVQRYHDEVLPRARRAYDLYRVKYATMAAAYPQVLVSQRMLTLLQLDYVRALGSAWQSAILLQHGLLSDGFNVTASR